MKIDQISQYGIQPYKKNVSKADTGLKPAQTDKVEISKQAVELQINSTFQAERQAKIDEIKNQIENGTYRVNTKEMAESLLSFYTKK